MLLMVASAVSAQDLKKGFQTPPQEARPRVWWHWMNGNITKDGIRKDIEWMHRVGIGGFHNFDAGMATPQVVEKRLTYMSPEWKDAFRYAVMLADSFGMEVATAACPGWSNTGGPWVKPEQAMKKLTWREMNVKGGKRLNMVLPAPFTTTGFFQNVPLGSNSATFTEADRQKEWYKDLYVLAVRRSMADKTMKELGAKVTSSGGHFTLEQLSDGDLAKAESLPADNEKGYAWIQYEFKKPQTIKALSVADGSVRSEWAAAPAPVTKHLEVSDDGKTFRRVCDIPHGGAARQTIAFEPTRAKYFRVVFDNPVVIDIYAALNPNKQEQPKSTPVAELMLYTVAKINHAEEKAGYATPSDLMEHQTTASAGELVTANDVIDLTDKVDADGNLVWDAPKGEWTIYRFGYSLTGKENHPASPEATGLEVTKIDKDAFTNFLEYYLKTYQDATGGLMGKRGLQYLLIDSYEAGWETWTPKMPQEFEKRRGYSLLKWLPVLTGRIIESAERSEQFLFDWRTTIGELIEECMYANADRIAKKYGLGTYFESHENGRLYLVDGMSAKSKADIPMAAMWTVVPGQKSANSSSMMAESDIHESASVAHLYGKKYVAAESLTANGLDGGAYSYFPGNLKATADLEMANGVNRFVIHESTHQPIDDKKPGLGLLIFGQWFNRHETWAEQAKPWTDYLARSSYMLQQGRNVADILYYYGEDDVVTSLFAHRHPEIPACYNYDYLNKEALLNLISYDGQHFVTPSGNQYQVLIIDKNCIHVSAEVQQKLDALKRQGAPIFDLKTQTVGEALSNIRPDVMADGMKDLRYVHRTSAEGEIYWVNNRRDEARSIDVYFRVSGLKPTLWHPETGETEDVSYEIKNGETVVRLNLVENDAVFVVFSGKTEQTKVIVPEKQEILFRHIDTPWTVRFDETWGGPGETTFNKLISYTESDNKGIKYYSGTTVYKNNVLTSEPELKQGRFVLDLGKVGCMAEVIVNGRNLGVLWKAPYKVDITEALKPGTNDFEIRVINQWANRIIGDKQPDCQKKYTYSAFEHFYRPDSELLPAGLMGPVDILLVQENPLPYTSIKPGQIWLDTNGKPIQAHGFQVMEKDGTYYWYGENKELTTHGSHVWTYGIRCYRSKDFYNWEDCGLIIEPDTTDYLSPLHYSQTLDRPHIVYAPKTGKYVCWIKSMDEDGYFVILEADDILGPYRYVRSLKPEGYGVGDFDMYVDPETQKGYVWFERPHWELICAELTDDCLDVTPKYSNHFVGRRPPFTREAPTHFVHQGKHYMFSSGTTGYVPNVSMIASFTDYHGQYRDLGNPHPTDKYNHSFCSQITDVVKISGRNLYVAVADRWMPQIANTTLPAEEVKRMITKYKNHQPFPQDFSEPKTKDKRNSVRVDWDVTYNATYVFQPIVFKNGKPQIEWKDEWRIEDYK